jgi:hypothetical protein
MKILRICIYKCIQFCNITKDDVTKKMRDFQKVILPLSRNAVKTNVLLKMSSKLFCAQSGSSIVFVDGIQIGMTNVTTLTMMSAMGVLTRTRENNAYIK